MTARLLALVGATGAGAAALILGRRMGRRILRARRRAERQARRAKARVSASAAPVTSATTVAETPGPVVPEGGAKDGGFRGEARDPLVSEAGFRSIRGIGPALEDRLRAAGVTSVRQIAAWNEADVEAVAPLLKVTPERIRSQAWVTQARALVRTSPAG